MKKKLVTRKRSRKSYRKFSRGSSTFSVFFILLLVVAGAVYLINGVSSTSFIQDLTPADAQKVTVITPTGGVQPGDKLQLQTLKHKPCTNTLAVDFLVDVSGSMGFDNKIDRSIQALNAFVQALPDTAVVGMQKFSDGTFVPPTGAQSLVELNYYKNVKPLTNVINSLKPSPPAVLNGATWTRRGFELARDKILQAKNANAFPGYQYALVFISDGVPFYRQDTESLNCLATADYVETPTIGDIVCFSRTMDPRSPGPNIPQELKDQGIKIFSVGIYRNAGSDLELLPHLQQLLRDAASDPDDQYYYNTFNASDLPAIFSRIGAQICE